MAADEDELDESFFVNELPRDLRCPVCLYVLKDPYQIPCGHRFCKKCIEDLKKEYGTLSCPVDRQLIGGELFPDMAAKRHINTLKVRCLHFRKGCTWTGDLVDRKTHLRTCQYETHNCPMCGATLQASQLESHQGVCPKRPVKCKYCKLELPLSDMDSHLANCSQFPVDCPNRCESIQMPRASVPNHLENDCPFKLITCSLKPFGCTDKVRRCDMAPHLENCAVKRISSLASVVVQQGETIAQLKQSLERCSLSVKQIDSTCYPSHGQFTWRVENIRKKIRTAQNSGTLQQTPDSYIYSPPFFTTEAGYKLCLCIYPAGEGSLSLYFVVMKGPYDDILQWPFQKHVRLVLINCRGGISIVKEINPDPRLHYFRRPKEEKNVGYGYPRFINLQKILAEDSEFVSSDSIFIRAIVYQ